MRKLDATEKVVAGNFFDAKRKECIACPYTAKVDYKIVCGMVYFDCMVSCPVCLERGK